MLSSDLGVLFNFLINQHLFHFRIKELFVLHFGIDQTNFFLPDYIRKKRIFKWNIFTHGTVMYNSSAHVQYKLFTFRDILHKFIGWLILILPRFYPIPNGLLLKDLSLIY